MTTVPLPHKVRRPGASRWRTALDGARDMTPMVIGVMPLALAIGAAIGASTVSPLAGWAGAPLIFGGAAQLTTVEMLAVGAAPAVIITSALALNARVLVYGAAAAPWFRNASRPRRLLLAAPLIDPLYVVCAARFERGDLDEREREAYYLGAAAFLAVAWLVAQAVAIVAGPSLPAALGLHIAAPLAFVGMLAKSLSGRPALVAATAAAVTATFATGLPFQSAVLIAVLVGILTGQAVAARTAKGARA